MFFLSVCVFPGNWTHDLTVQYYLCVLLIFYFFIVLVMVVCMQSRSSILRSTEKYRNISFSKMRSFFKKMYTKQSLLICTPTLTYDQNKSTHDSAREQYLQILAKSLVTLQKRTPWNAPTSPQVSSHLKGVFVQVQHQRPWQRQLCMAICMAVYSETCELL